MCLIFTDDFMYRTYSLCIPAFRTADDTAFTAVWIKFIRAVKSPVAWGCFFCSAKMNLVNVKGSTSIA